MPPLDLFLADDAATVALGESLAKKLRVGDALCLNGPLGAGKSTLARGLVRALTRPDEEVPSPTFTLVQAYEGRDFPIAHFDLYRLTDPDEAYEIGIEDALEFGAAIIEWPERLEGRLPPDRLDIDLFLEGDARRARLTAHGSWKDRELGS
jgi:tRNA threonylcarbamoyladenosine biosynthesis protein TsaE